MKKLLQDTRIAPSILSANFTRLGEEVQEVLEAGARVIHVDVMDGHFTPVITLGPAVVGALSPLVHAAGGILDVHLMIERPERFIDEFCAAGADVLVVHQEACTHLHRALTRIREHGVDAGVAINPMTPIEALAEARFYCDLVVLMSVNPGFGGQRFIPTSLDKIERARAYLPATAALELDGGVCLENAAAIVEAGANILVAGSSVFGSPGSGERYRELALVASCDV